MKTQLISIIIVSLFISEVIGESPTIREPIFLSEIEATASIRNAFETILSYNGLGEGDAQKLILDFLGKIKSDTVTGADAKFIIMRTHDLPSWMMGDPPKQMPVSADAFKNYYMKAWRESILKEEKNILTPCLAYVLSTYVSVYQESWKDEIFMKLFFEDLRAYKQRFPDAHVWTAEIVKEEIQFRRKTPID